MKIAVLADIHGNIIALNEVLKDIRKEGITQFIILGDIIMVGPAPEEVFTTIKSLNPICWIKGNTDMWLEEMNADWEPITEKDKELFEYYLYSKARVSSDCIDFLTQLPTQKVVRIKTEDILCVHGSPRSVTEIMDSRVSEHELEKMVEKTGENTILCGHSHMPYIGAINCKQIFNVGSVGRSLDGNTAACYGIVDMCENCFPAFTIRRVEYSLNEIVNMAIERNFPYIDKYIETVLNARLA